MVEHISRWFAVIIVAASLLGPGAPAMASTPANLHPYLATLASETPEAVVSVIVQTSVEDRSVEARVRDLGGVIVADLPIIHGFAAELPAARTLDLARTWGVRAVSYNAPMTQTACGDCTTTGKLANTYIRSIRADQVWNRVQGRGIGVAVVDSGVNWQTDLYTSAGQNRVVANVAFHNGYNATSFDAYSHGSHVAGIVGGNGRASDGAYIGVAPQASIINVKVSDDLNQGSGTALSVVQGLQWILQNRAAYNIRVVNLSLNSAVAESYHTSAIDAAVEVLWFSGIVVVASSGNTGKGADMPPANDPFIITVGSVDDKGTNSISDDVVSSFSTYGTTGAGVAKPDLVAPGRNIVSLMGNSGQGLPAAHAANIVSYNGAAYFKMSGTSMAAPMVAGAVALLLQDEPRLTPDQVKYRLLATANKSWGGYNSTTAGAGILDVTAAVNGTSTQSANTGRQASKMLWTGSQPVTWTSVNWNSVNWNSVNWNSVNWNSVNWNSVNWNSTYWGP